MIFFSLLVVVGRFAKEELLLAAAALEKVHRQLTHSLTSFLHLLCSEAVFKSMPNKLPINIFAKQQKHHKHLEFLRKNVRLPAAAAWSAKPHSSGRNK